MSSLLLNMAGPVNWLHPTNRGLIGHWMCVPGLAGGPRVHNLLNQNHGSLSTSRPTWQGPKGRLGGFGSLQFSGDTQAIQIADDPRFQNIPDITAMAWILPTSAGTQQIIFEKYDGSGGTEFSMDISAGEVRSFTGGLVTTTGDPIVAGVWTHVALTRSGSLHTLYVNGVSLASGTDAGYASSTGNLAIGARASNISQLEFTGAIDDVSLHNRALSAGEVRFRFEESKRGYPNILNWLKAGPILNTVAAPVTNRRRRVLLGAA